MEGGFIRKILIRGAMGLWILELFAIIAHRVGPREVEVRRTQLCTGVVNNASSTYYVPINLIRFPSPLTSHLERR
jgi:hypothetical protein